MGPFLYQFIEGMKHLQSLLGDLWDNLEYLVTTQQIITVLMTEWDMCTIPMYWLINSIYNYYLNWSIPGQSCHQSIKNPWLDGIKGPTGACHDQWWGILSMCRTRKKEKGRRETSPPPLRSLLILYSQYHSPSWRFKSL